VEGVRVYIGWDEREQEAYKAAVRSLAAVSPQALVTPLKAEKLAACGLLRRSQDRRGVIYDLPSNAPCSTDFAISRFLVPHLAQTGWALFTDCDVIFLSDIAELFEQADPDKAVMVVKHPNLPSQGVKMDGQAQVAYPRKNWSSVILWNADHPANRRLSLQDVNERPGRDLHAFYWLADSEIGSLSPDWNWLVGVQEKPLFPKIAHFTLGCPGLPNWNGAEHDELWWKYGR
jgi:lipopolysaccharide biosynthesis glycosyltransferase